MPGTKTVISVLFIGLWLAEPTEPQDELITGKTKEGNGLESF